LIAECGLDMTAFPTVGHFASWAGACPGHHESAGRRRSGQTRPGPRWLTDTLTECAKAAARAKGTYFAAHFAQIRGRRGEPKAIGALRHDILVAYFHIVRDRVPFRELGPDWQRKRYSPEHRARRPPTTTRSPRLHRHAASDPGDRRRRLSPPTTRASPDVAQPRPNDCCSNAAANSGIHRTATMRSGRPLALPPRMEGVAQSRRGADRLGAGVSAEVVRGGRRAAPQAGIGAVVWRQSFSRLCVAAIRRHSDLAADLPRRWKRSQRRLNLVSAKTGSIMPWRLA
jgi:hypothetical protein